MIIIYSETYASIRKPV